MNKNKIYISLNLGFQSKQVFIISYTKDGGFFIKDLMRIVAIDKKCSIYNLTTDLNNHGNRTGIPNYNAFTSGEVKLTHHFDGNAQISGKGVLSGYNENGIGRGAAIKSFTLTENNDGGPVFTYLMWGLEECRNSKKSDMVLDPDPRYIHDSHIKKKLNGYVIKGFYILKKNITPNNPLPSTVRWNNPIEGEIEISLVPSPENVPGVLGLFATYSNHGFESKSGFTLMGAPGQIYDDHFCDGLSIIYPFQGSLKDCKDLDYKKDL